MAKKLNVFLQDIHRTYQISC